jgi:hypothetical protein
MRKMMLKRTFLKIKEKILLYLSAIYALGSGSVSAF